MNERILIIDDQLDMLMLLKMIIEDNTRYEVETTNNPAEGLNFIEERPFDAVITDLKMPGIDGMELFHKLKGRYPNLPVIIITAYGSQEASDEAVQEGIADFITKPFKKERILISIRKALEISRLKKENLELKQKLNGNA